MHTTTEALCDAITRAEAIGIDIDHPAVKAMFQARDRCRAMTHDLNRVNALTFEDAIQAAVDRYVAGKITTEELSVTVAGLRDRNPAQLAALVHQAQDQVAGKAIQAARALPWLKLLRPVVSETVAPLAAGSPAPARLPVWLELKDLAVRLGAFNPQMFRRPDNFTGPAWLRGEDQLVAMARECEPGLWSVEEVLEAEREDLEREAKTERPSSAMADSADGPEAA